MKITIIGSGYVGLVTGACLSEFGNDVICVDIDNNKVDKLNKGNIPIFEPGLEGLIKKNFEMGRIKFTTDFEMAVDHGNIIFIAVGTPPSEDGSADLNHVLSASEKIATYMKNFKIIVNKSTVPVGTGDLVQEKIVAVQSKFQKSIKFSVVSNPEFLKEGSAIADFMKPDRVVIGTEDVNSEELLRELYSPFCRNHDRIIVMSRRSSELTKYAANAMLATRISFMNELAILSEKVNADIEEVRAGIGSDPRIGYHFLYPGIGYGGSCFPKDVKALAKTAKDFNVNLSILDSTEQINYYQKRFFLEKIYSFFGKNLHGFKFSIWGLSFKPETDDMREAPSVFIINELIKSGASVVAFDPIAIENAKVIFQNVTDLEFSNNPIEILEGADALLILTEWKIFRSPDFDLIKLKMKNSVVFDGRNLFNPKKMKELGFHYFSIGRGNQI